MQTKAATPVCLHLHPLSSQRRAGWQLNLVSTAGLPQEIVFSLKVVFLLVSGREMSYSWKPCVVIQLATVSCHLSCMKHINFSTHNETKTNVYLCSLSIWYGKAVVEVRKEYLLFTEVKFHYVLTILSNKDTMGAEWPRFQRHGEGPMSTLTLYYREGHFSSAVIGIRRVGTSCKPIVI